VAADKTIVVRNVAVPSVKQIDDDVVSAAFLEGEGDHSGKSGIRVAFVPMNHKPPFMGKSAGAREGRVGGGSSPHTRLMKEYAVF
jgi:hypothetical protein